MKKSFTVKTRPLNILNVVRNQLGGVIRVRKLLVRSFNKSEIIFI